MTLRQAQDRPNDDRLNDPPKVEWEGKYIRIVTRGGWEYVERCGGVSAVVILAEHEGRIILIEQSRVPLKGRTCLELPAGLVGDARVVAGACATTRCTVLP